MIKKLLTLLLAIAIISLAFMALSDLRSPKEYESLDIFDKTMFKELSKLYVEFQNNPNELWNSSYNMNTLPLVLVRVNKDKGILYKYSYLINVKDADKIFNTKEMLLDTSLKLPKIYKMGKLSFPSAKFLFPSNFGTVELEGNKVFYFKYHDEMISNEDPYWGFPTFMLHEAFHNYKQEKWDYDIKGDRIVDYPLTIEQLSLLGIEFNLTDAALSSNSQKDIDILLKDITLLRAYRYKKWSQLIDETKSEAIEGTSVYMEVQYAKLKNRISRLLLNSSFEKATFIDFYNALANKQIPISYLERNISYDRGASLCLLMDEVGIDWKPLIDNSITDGGQTQYEILYNYYNVKDLNLGDEIMRIKTLDGYSTYEDRAKKIITNSQSKNEQ